MKCTKEVQSGKVNSESCGSGFVGVGRNHSNCFSLMEENNHRKLL